jgi:hypothetical protein
MSTQARSQCDTCVRLRSPLDDDTPAGVTGPYCEAFPDGIPTLVFRNGVDHRGEVEGDHGLRWASNGEAFPDWAFDPDVLRPPSPEDLARQRIVSDYPLDLDPPP